MLEIGKTHYLEAKVTILSFNYILIRNEIYVLVEKKDFSLSERTLSWHGALNHIPKTRRCGKCR